MSQGDPATPPTLESFLLRWSVALLTLAGLLLGLVLFSMRTPTYESRTIISVVNPLGTMGDEAALVLSDAVLGPVTNDLSTEPEVDVEANEVADLLTITVRSDDPDEAAQIATQIGEAYVQAQTTVAVRVADAAEPNTSPVAPNRLVYLVVGTALGALVGTAVSGVQRLRNLVPTRLVADGRLAPIRPARQPSSEFAHQMLTASDRDDPDPDFVELYDALDVRISEADPIADVWEPAPLPIDVREPAPAPRAAETVTWAGTTTTGSSHNTVSVGERVDVDLDASVEFADGTGRIGLDDDVRIDLADGNSHIDLTVGSSAPVGPTDPADRTAAPAPPIDLAGSPSAPNLAPIDSTDQPPRPPDPARSATSSDQPARTATTFMDQLMNEPSGDTSTSPSIDQHPAPPAAPSGRFVADPADRSLAETLSSDAGEAAHSGTAAFTAGTTETETEERDVASERRGNDQNLQRAVTDAVEIAEARYEATLADRDMGHEEHVSALEANHERQVSQLKRDLADARKEARTATAHAQRLAGDDQHRIGDLQAQAEALETEIAGLRNQLESERIAHLRELTTERDAADRALDDARREFREQIEANDQAGRESLSIHRTELEALLAQQRSDHQAELDRQHREHEAALTRLRQRRKDDLTKLSERHREEMTTHKAESDENASRVLHQTKQTLAELRATEKRMSNEIDELRQSERSQRSEIGVLRTALGDAEREQAESERTLRSELTEATSALEAERERNAALRDDVVRRTAEAHQAVDRAIEDRSQQLAELEALVARQREHSEQRIRETNAAAEERSRAAARREAELHARIVRLERELDERRPQTG